MYRISNIVAALIVAVTLFASPSALLAAKHKTTTTAPVTTGELQLFSSERAAQRHCPRDEVVWLNTNSGIYHEKGMRWYANTKSGAFVCKAAADAAGDRDTRNGQ